MRTMVRNEPDTIGDNETETFMFRLNERMPEPEREHRTDAYGRCDDGETNETTTENRIKSAVAMFSIRIARYICGWILCKFIDMHVN